MKHKLILAGFILALASVVQAAELKLAAVFSDHMVLQREKPVAVWGWADPGEKITVEFGDQKKTATADSAGKWMAKLDPMQACAEPRDLLVKSEIGNPASPEAMPGRSRQSKIVDVLVGEVWLGSGQSNMAMGVSRARDFEKEKAAANLPLIRMFREESKSATAPQADGSGKWDVCSPETVGAYSATLYFFGRELHRELKVPVGLINSSVGGTPIESWVAAEAQTKMSELKELVAAEAKANAAFDPVAAKAGYEKALARWKELSAKAKAAGKPAPKQPRDPIAERSRKGGSGGLFNGKIAPLIPFAIRGAVWYQGEANSQPGKGHLYQFQLPALVSDWRARWGEEFPFAWVQLPNFKKDGDGWMLVREGMLKTLRLPKTGMAITVDIGESGNIHPGKKQEVGRRLSLWALSDVYGQKVSSTCGPLPAGHEVKGGEVMLSFTHADGGLKAKEGELKGFMIAGEDKQWKNAQARIDGDKVIISNPDVKNPAAVRYAWATDPSCNLCNGAGLPASPFRTDDWPVDVAIESK